MHITTNPFLSILFFPIVKAFEFIGEHFPVFTVRLRYFIRFKRLPNLIRPEDLNEKILYLKLFSDVSQWADLADKFLVREFVKENGLERILVPLYGVWSSVDTFNLDKLPRSFILKANNGDGKGSNLLVKDSKVCNEKKIKMIIKKWLTKKHIGALAAEPHYKLIKPKVIAEKLLTIDNGSTSLIDYKIWCFNGKPFSILTCSNRKNGHVCLGCYDLNWNYHPECMKFSKEYPAEEVPLKKPSQLDEMIKIAKVLSKSFPQVRVDLYEIDGKIFFGEMTFTSLGGMMNYYTPEYLRIMGKQINLNL